MCGFPPGVMSALACSGGSDGGLVEPGLPLSVCMGEGVLLVIPCGVCYTCWCYLVIGVVFYVFC